MIGNNSLEKTYQLDSEPKNIIDNYGVAVLEDTQIVGH